MTSEGAADRPAKAAAFFDLDKTLMAGSSGMHFGRAAYRSGMVRRRDLVRWGVDHLRFRLRGASEEQSEALLGEVKALLRGVPQRDLARMTPELMAGVLPRIYPKMLDEVHAHQDDGRATFIVSAAGDELVQLVAHVLGMDGGIGTRYGVDPEGRMTGELEGPFMYGGGKEEAIRRFAEEQGISLEDSFAYSDSASDLPMLQAVGNAVAVNPDPALAEFAKREGWRVMRFERLGRRLAISGATLLALAAGGSGHAIAARRRSRLASARRRGRRRRGPKRWL